MFRSPRSPHSLLYKNSGRSPAALRDALRKNALDRLKEGRFDRQNARRSLRFGSDVREILKNAIEEEMGFASFEEQMAMLEELQVEIMREFDEHEAQEALEEAALADHLDPDAFCPSCKRNPMQVDHTGCLCRKCGFAYQFRQQSVPTKSVLAETLHACFRNHGETECPTLPDPIVRPDGLFLVCSTCTHSQLVIS